MADEVKITSEVELQDGVKEGAETENKKVKKVDESKSKEKVAETLKKVGKADDEVGELATGEEEEVEEKDIDLFSESAMYNAYSICHNVQVCSSDLDYLPKISTIQDFMYFRGYRWQGMVKKKKKKKKKF